MRTDWLPTNYQFAWEVVNEYKVWLWEGVQLTLEVAQDRLKAVRIGGQAVRVSDGTLRV